MRESAKRGEKCQEREAVCSKPCERECSKPTVNEPPQEVHSGERRGTYESFI